jgi:hypothetical protein
MAIASVSNPHPGSRARRREGLVSQDVNHPEIGLGAILRHDVGNVAGDDDGQAVQAWLAAPERPRVGREDVEAARRTASNRHE